jgi:hypothetical protein
MISKIEMQAMDAVIGIHREMRKANEIDRERLTFNFPIHYQYLTKSLCSYDTE